MKTPKLEKASKIVTPLIQKHEGLSLHTYIDPVGVPTIGYGHTGKAAFSGNVITPETANTLMRMDIREAQNALVPFEEDLNPNQLAALTSFVFNFGGKKFAASTLRKKLADKDYEGAAEQFSRWIKGRVNGELVTLGGLVKRRAHEQKLFLTPYDQKKK